MSTTVTALQGRSPLHNEQQLSQAIDEARAASGERLGQILLDSGALTQQALDDALQTLRREKGANRRHLGQVLVDSGAVSKAAVTAALCRQFGIPQVRLGDMAIKPDVLSVVPEGLALRMGILPLACHDRLLVVATPDPFDEQTMTALRFYTGCTIEPVLADADEIGQIQNRYYVADAASQAAAEMEYTRPLPPSPATTGTVESQAHRKPIVKLVDGLLLQAVHRGASDVNIRPERDHVAVHFRIDGRMRLMRTLDKGLLAAVVARLKITADMDVAEHRLPQDGHTRIRVGDKQVDVRISVMPTVNGESAVLRILDRDKGLRAFDTLGFTPADTGRLRDIISRPHGLFLVTGPTGSGKSTTLNAMMREIRSTSPHIITVEDPVEYDLEGIEQIQVQPAIGYTFAEALRHILRHDPDVVMVGEIRDLDTARIANKAALTGHLVLSTLHTNDAASAVTRLVDMGVEPYLLAGTLLGVLAQRLVRLNCPRCRIPDNPPAALRTALGVGTEEPFQRGAGCGECDHTGVRGRSVVYELLPVDPSIGEMIHAAPSAREIQARAESLGMVPLTDHALSLARRGEIALQEVYNVRLR